MSTASIVALECAINDAGDVAAILNALIDAPNVSEEVLRESVAYLCVRLSEHHADALDAFCRIYGMGEYRDHGR
jgi:hypothetical protein